ncbi:MAG TPA: hypothetical protein VGQ37_05270 [Vicinamibacterales bacterium]|jgi:hypothetical protein|nr:hypothetical protein [Vicinamibacterales bacterium]
MLSGGRRLAWAIGALAVVWAAPSAQQLPSEPRRQFGTSVTGAFEGWWENADGSRTFLVGYLNRNNALEIDVPIGPDNRIEPGGPDLGQPSHFLQGRQWGMFTVTVPKEFTGADQRLTWTIVANGQSTSIPLRLHPDYNINPFSDVAVKNTPPSIRLAENGAATKGPLALLAAAPMRTVARGAPLALPLWADDDGKFANATMTPPKNLPSPVELVWSKYRGPGAVTFDKLPPVFEVLAGGPVNVPFRGKATATARFSEPGDYVLHVTANDFSGEGGSGELCCWSTALVKVHVTP